MMLTPEQYLTLGLADDYVTPATISEQATRIMREYGADICKARGDHDYSIRVPGTSNMYLCYRCGEPGWEVPVVEENDES